MSGPVIYLTKVESMPLPLSQLVYSRFQEPESRRRVITLHRDNQFLDAMKEVGLAVNPDGVVLGLQSSKGVYLGRTVVGYTWFVGPLDQPSPVHYGDTMQEIERFLWDEVDRQQTTEAVLPFLVGDEQGAIMSLAMAGATPDLISGVVAINATFPIVHGWEPPLAPLAGLPILLVNTADADDLAQYFEGWGATVTVLAGDDGAVPVEAIRDWIAAQPIRTRVVDSSLGG